MVKTVVNLTQEALIGEIETILNGYPHHPYQQAFAIPDLRQELIAYVLTRIPCVYNALDTQTLPSITYKFSRGCLAEQLQLQTLIHQGICSILQEKSDWVSHHLPETEQCSFEPSHWFG